MVIPIGVCTPTGCEESSHPVQGAVFMGFVVPVVRAEKRARTTGYCPFTPPAWQKRPNSGPLLAKLAKEEWLRHQKMLRSPLKRRRRGGRSHQQLPLSDHPVRSYQRWLRGIFLRSRPPLLFKLSRRD